jgi:hypothetical protein
MPDSTCTCTLIKTRSRRGGKEKEIVRVGSDIEVVKMSTARPVNFPFSPRVHNASERSRVGVINVNFEPVTIIELVDD